jgi:hypothetical protein
MFGAILSFLSGGVLDRVFETVDKQIEAQTDREALKADIIKEHLRTRPDFMKAGGFWLMLVFALPLAVWWGAVILYSILWCARCAYPQTWTIAALPAPLDEWAGLIVMSIFGVIGVTQFRR